jgi:hypothetical protein
MNTVSIQEMVKSERRIVRWRGNTSDHLIHASAKGSLPTARAEPKKICRMKWKDKNESVGLPDIEEPKLVKTSSLPNREVPQSDPPACDKNIVPLVLFSLQE